MNTGITIAVFGANGNLGRNFVNQALEAGYKIRAFVRSASKFNHLDNPNVDIIEGDATNYNDVERAVAGADIVVSCLGNVKVNNQYTTIMYAAHNNILDAASKQTKIPRSILISSVGCGGTSWIIKQILIRFAGKQGWDDYEKADKRIRDEKKVPFVLVRPYALTDKEGKGKYFVTKKQNGTFLRPISRSDVAKFMLDAVSDSQWDGGSGVLLGGKK